ncbi:MAG: circularly permuted type 2 ATP-grasp protein [Isosphaeraceae bacterium]|nr:circularly permuted type 2 ATP-grasp protein [Isosphaeraceae bacterium]
MTGIAPPAPQHDPRPASSRAGLDYEHDIGSFDETLDADGGLRPYWRGFFQQINAIGLPEMHRRWEEVKHLIRENGITYNVYGDPRGLDRPWELDPIPLLIAADDAQSLETGLVQRARLLDAILADIYGQQVMLKEGVLPPELVFGHRGFLRPCHGLQVPGDRRLHLYAVDLGRAPDGSIFVLNDRTQAPSGAGYALENRIVLSRLLPEAFRDCRVQRLALFFRTVRETLRSIAPRNRDNPRIVLLTPGPYNETYFEHAYLARYLGYTLVEGGDLTVRDSRVYLKLLGGLQPVDVILRRLDDEYCDPLELRGDSFLGVPGLVQAVRAGNVAVANTLGSGLVESPGFLPYLPALCRRLLGEELLIPSATTWWCGDPGARDHVLANLPHMVIKPAFPFARFDPIFGEELSADELHRLSEKIRARPLEYVGQQQITLSTAPVLEGGRLRPRHLVIRAFLAATDTSYAVMPGGLTRIAASGDTLVVSMQKGGGSKDTWVLSAGPVSNFSLLPSTVQPVELSRGGGDLPSRVADDLFWLGRYVERAEGIVRLLRGILVRLTEKSGLAEVPELPALLRALTLQTKTRPGFLGSGAEQRLAAPEDELRVLVFDPERAGSLAETINALHRVAGKVRDRISTDMWRIIGGLDLPARPGTSREPDARPPLGEILDLLDRRVVALAAFGGLVAESMTRGQGWRFLDMGRRIERTFHMLGLLRGALVSVSGTEGPLLEALLEIADSAMTYRRRYMSSLQTAPVLDLLLADEDNPRSLAYQLVALTAAIDDLPRVDTSPGRSPEQRLMLGALTRVRVADIDRLARADADGRRTGLDDLLARLEADLPVLADSLTRHYLSHLQVSRQFATTS